MLDNWTSDTKTTWLVFIIIVTAMLLISAVILY